MNYFKLWRRNADEVEICNVADLIRAKYHLERELTTLKFHHWTVAGGHAMPSDLNDVMLKAGLKYVKDQIKRIRDQ